MFVEKLWIIIISANKAREKGEAKATIYSLKITLCSLHFTVISLQADQLVLIL